GSGAHAVGGAHGGGGGAVHGDRDGAGQRREDLPEEPLEVERLHAAAREVGGLQRFDLGEPLGAGGGGGNGAAPDPLGPFGERGSGADGALAVHGLVGVDGDVRRPGGQQQQRALVGPPDPAGAGHVRVDDVHVQRGAREAFGRGGLGGARAEALEVADRSGSAADEDEA